MFLISGFGFFFFLISLSICDLLVGLVTVIVLGFMALLQTWWLMGCYEFEIFLLGLVVLYSWIDLLL